MKAACKVQYSSPGAPSSSSQVSQENGIRPNDLLDRILVVKLAGSKFGTPEDIAQMTNQFDETTKLRFNNATEASYIRVGTVRDKDPAFNIRSGQLKLPG